MKNGIRIIRIVLKKVSKDSIVNSGGLGVGWQYSNLDGKCPYTSHATSDVLPCVSSLFSD